MPDEKNILQCKLQENYCEQLQLTMLTTDSKFNSLSNPQSNLIQKEWVAFYNSNGTRFESSYITIYQTEGI